MVAALTTQLKSTQRPHLSHDASVPTSRLRAWCYTAARWMVGARRHLTTLL